MATKERLGGQTRYTTQPATDRRKTDPSSTNRTDIVVSTNANEICANLVPGTTVPIKIRTRPSPFPLIPFQPAASEPLPVPSFEMSTRLPSQHGTPGTAFDVVSNLDPR